MFWSPCLGKKWQILWFIVTFIQLTYGLVETDDFTDDSNKYYTNGWGVHIKGKESYIRAKRIAKKHGFEKVSKIGSLDDFYHFEHPSHPERSKRSADSKTDLLKQESEILWVEQQHEYRRPKRGLHHDDIIRRGIQPRFADPLWDEQWYLDDKRSALDLDVNVIPVWNAGISGKGVVVTILDDGIEHNHTDLVKNYDPAASWDVNDNDPDPFPRYDPTNENKHGTRCAGEVASQANNTKCGVGVAYNARVGGVRMLDGRVTDRVEAESLSLNPQYIDIYSASWGPSDDGMTVEGPGTLASAAFLNGITKGRGGLGSIYVWASGNGGRHDDSCNCDGYTASIYTLSISSSSDHGESPWYSEACSSTLATTLSSGAHGEKRIVTTDLHNQCTERHTGTSASAPLAGGIIALALEKNPKLTWRDVQHLVVHSANWIPLKRDPDWRMNGIGLHVNEKFGFGLLDAEALVRMSDRKTFKQVPEKSECKGKLFSTPKVLRWDQTLSADIDTDGCAHTKDAIRYLEHVQIILTIDYTRRGDLTIFLTTPMGTRSNILPVRSEDASDEGFKKWAFMTTHAWGEDPRGKWLLEIKDGGETRTNTGALRDWQLILHGTKQKPHHQNITHPDIPLKRKAVPDDTRNPAKSSVQITQITYTFGDNGTPLSAAVLPEQTKTTTTTTTQMTNKNDYIPTQAIAHNIQITNPYASLQNTPQAAPQQGMLGSEYNYANVNTNYNAAYQRSNLPNPYMESTYANTNNNYDNHNYANLFVQQPNYAVSNAPVYPQNNINTGAMGNNMVSRPAVWTRSNNLQLFTDPAANLWDFFGHLNRKRSAEEDSTNSFVDVVKKLRAQQSK